MLAALAHDRGRAVVIVIMTIASSSLPTASSISKTEKSRTDFLAANDANYAKWARQEFFDAPFGIIRVIRG